jgi:hypothetical protein
MALAILATGATGRYYSKKAKFLKIHITKSILVKKPVSFIRASMSRETLN